MRELRRGQEYEREKQKARPRRVANAIAAHVSKRATDAMGRLMVHQKLRQDIEHVLSQEVCHEPDVDNIDLRQFKGYHPGLAKKYASERDFTLEHIALLFVPVEKVISLGYHVGKAGWVAAKGPQAARWLKNTYELAVGPLAQRFRLAIHIPHGSKWAVQRWTPKAFRARANTKAGSPLYKQGSFPNPKAEPPFLGSDVANSRFLAHEHPLETADFAARHGLHSGKDWVMRVRLKEGADAIVRKSVPGPAGPGGAFESVIEENTLRIDWFHMP